MTSTPTPTRPTRLHPASDKRDFLARMSVSVSWNAAFSARRPRTLQSSEINLRHTVPESIRYHQTQSIDTVCTSSSRSSSTWYDSTLFRCQRERTDRRERRSCQQLHCLELCRRTWLFLQCNVGWSYPTARQGLYSSTLSVFQSCAESLLKLREYYAVYMWYMFQNIAIFRP